MIGELRRIDVEDLQLVYSSSHTNAQIIEVKCGGIPRSATRLRGVFVGASTIDFDADAKQPDNLWGLAHVRCA